MENKKQIFTNKIAEFISVFKIFKQRIEKENLMSEYKEFFDNFDTLVESYNLLEKYIEDESTLQMFEPFYNIIDDMIRDLKKELELKDDVTNDNILKVKLKNIDELLKTPNMHEEDMNKLLDERSQLI